MLRNNLTPYHNEIPNIKIKQYLAWKNAICVEIFNDFLILDLFLTLKSYSDSLILSPTQIFTSVFKIEANRTIFTDSLPIHSMKNMNVLDFSIWFTERWNKNCEYFGEEIHTMQFIIVFPVPNTEILYPNYPWSIETLENIKNFSSNDENNVIKALTLQIELLKNKNK